MLYFISSQFGGGRVVQRCWINLQGRGVLLIWIIVGQGPIALAIGAGGGCMDMFSLIYHFSFLSPSLWETVRYRLKYCLKGPLNPEQPTNQNLVNLPSTDHCYYCCNPTPFMHLVCQVLCSVTENTDTPDF